MEPALRVVSATVAIGAATGAVVGGIGGRVAMRILFLTSDAALVTGVESDDGFSIGRFDLSDTAGLVLITTVIGVVAALLYLVARPFITGLGRAEIPLMAVFYGVVGGAMLVHRGGVDFTLIEPVALAVAMFVLIFAAFAAIAGTLIRRAAAGTGWTARRRWRIVGLPLVVLAVPPLFVVGAAALATNVVSGATTTASLPWRVLRVVAVFVMAILFVVGLVDLTRDVLALT